MRLFCSVVNLWIMRSSKSQAMTRPRLLLAVILTAVVVLCVFLFSMWFNEGPLWKLMMLKRVPLLGVENRGWRTEYRWSGRVHGRLVMWDLESGFKSIDCEFRNGTEIQSTVWRIDGTVAYQTWETEKGTKFIPPWWWGVENQTEPTAPWWNEKD